MAAGWTHRRGSRRRVLWGACRVAGAVDWSQGPSTPVCVQEHVGLVAPLALHPVAYGCVGVRRNGRAAGQ